MKRSDLTNEEKLDAIYEMTLENNDVLRTIRRQQYFANTFRFLYWCMVIGAIGSAYYFVRPVVTMISDNSAKIEETMVQFNHLRNQLPETKIVNQLLQSMKARVATSTDVEMQDNGVVDGPVR